MIAKIFMPESGATLKKTYMWTAVAGIIYAGSSFVMSLVITNLLGAEGFGVYTNAMAIAMLLGTIGLYNVRMFQVSDVLEQYSFADYSVMRILSAVVMVVAGAIWLLIAGYRGAELIVIIALILFKLGEAISDLFEGRYQQKERYDVSCRGVVFKTVLYMLVFIGCLAVTKNLALSASLLAIIYLVSIIIIDSRLVPKFGRTRLRLNINVQGKLIAECTPLFINSFLITYILNAAKYTMEQYHGKAYLGIFNSLYMMAFVINLFAAFALKPLITILSDKYLSGDKKGFVKMMARQSLIIVGLTIVAIIGAWFLGTIVLTLIFGIDLSLYRVELCLMLVGGAFTALYQLFQYAIIIMRHQIMCLIGSIITAILTWFFTPVLTKNYGIMGATISFVISMASMSLILFVLNWYFLRKELPADE
jgi:Membrane protein involved in the export of O-antigen and teichoic acid